MLTKRHVITHVTFTAIELLENSYLYNTDLWPKDGVVISSNTSVDKNDVIGVRPVDIQIIGNTATGILLFNMVNLSYPRIIEQFPHLELLMDQSYINDVFFEFNIKTTIGLGLKKTFGQMKFKFTYTQNQSII